ncbi:hypothetical protein BDN71DRAFT_1434314 [Pleurotus eryngii]|uniref:FAD binding domain-containing protein n=1 Tax=Pleurotus eryngii TaxID=5323 RepID=A0A9P6D3A5_PLEER|nr:hypothetical protein BDN71DRAFT_1434314 [Pleurotus eryngii]
MDATEGRRRCASLFAIVCPGLGPPLEKDMRAELDSTFASWAAQPFLQGKTSCPRGTTILDPRVNVFARFSCAESGSRRTQNYRSGAISSYDVWDLSAFPLTEDIHSNTSRQVGVFATNDTHFDVLVVGMGPAGLICALSLAKAGMRTKIIDRRAPGAQYGNADGIQPRPGIPTASSNGFSTGRFLSMQWLMIFHRCAALPSSITTFLGANSWVRRFFDIPLRGDLASWYQFTLLNKLQRLSNEMHNHRTNSTIITIPREGEKIRFYVQMSLDDCQLTPDGRVDKSYLSSEAVRHKVIGRIQAGMSPFEAKFTEIFWWTIFAIPQRVAKQFSVQDRVFIVGDACHQHSPKAEQGANAAMCDSHNLAWKLAHVIKGWVSPNILRTYEVERKGYAQELINFDKEISETLESDPESYGRVLHRQNMFTRLLIFHGDVRTASNLADLARLEKEVARCVGVLKHPVLYTILDNREDEVQWTDVPRVLRSWKHRQDLMNVYELLGADELGSIVLVRPDGYVSMVQELGKFNGDELTSLLIGL